MYAIIQSGGHQVKVEPGAVVTVDRVDGQPGEDVSLETVLLVAKDSGEVLTGAPYVANARVVATIDGETRGAKIRIFKKKRRKQYRRTKGHRSTFTRVRIKDILV